MVGYTLAIGDAASGEREPGGDGLLVARVHVAGVADVGRHRHGGVGQRQGAALRVANLKDGDGAEIKAGDTAVIQYTGVIWKPGDQTNGTVFDSSWTSGSPVNVVVKKGQTVPGLVTALAGQRVGSQVLAILPPKQAYGSQSTSTIPANATLVFVVDILGKG